MPPPAPSRPTSLRHSPASPSQPSGPVFVSYASKDIDIARALVAALRGEGLAVTWDQDIPAGKDFRQAIGEFIRAAPAVVVIWSRESVRSRYVVDEAALALASDKLVTTRVDDLSPLDVPIGFGSLNIVPVADVARVREALTAPGR